MNNQVGSLEVRWALYGKPPGDPGEHNVLKCSHGVKKCPNCRPLAQVGVTSEIYGLKFGRAAAGQQASFRHWQDGGKRYLGMTIFQIGDTTSADRRDMAVARFYEFPADWVSDHGVRLAALYDAAAATELPGEGDARPLRLDVALGDRPIVEFLRESAQASTLLLQIASALLDRPVIVTAGPIDLKKRLDLLDVVLTLLPAWFRAEVSATTWTDKPRKEYRLAFGSEADRGYTAASWESGITDHATIRRYATLLEELCMNQAHVEPMIRYLAALRATKSRSGKHGTSTLATDDLSLFHRLTTFDFTSPDRARISELLQIVRSENARHLAIGEVHQIPGFAIAAAGIGIQEAVDLLAALWSAEIANQTARAAVGHLSAGRTSSARLLMSSAARKGGVSAFLKAVISEIESLDAGAGMLPPEASEKARTELALLLAETSDSADSFAAICAVLLEAEDLGRRVLAVIARDRPKSVQACISVLVKEADAFGNWPLWLRAIAPWSLAGMSAGRPGGRHAAATSNDKAPGVWSELNLDAIAVGWAVSHALHVPDPVNETWALVAELGREASAAAAIANICRSQEFAWALTNRFGTKLPPPARAHADLARISIGLAIADVPESGEAETSVNQYLAACLDGCRSAQLSQQDQHRLRQLLSDSLLTGESPTMAVAAGKLLDSLAISDNADDQEWLIAEILDDGGRRPRVGEWLLMKGKGIIGSLVHSARPTSEIQAARNLRLLIRSLREADADTPEALDLLAQAAANDGFGLRQKPSPVGTVLREMRAWPSRHKPSSVADFLDRWKHAMAEQGLSPDEAESRADDASSEIMSGIWGPEAATLLGGYYSKMIALKRSRLETQIEISIANRTRVNADIADRRAEIEKLEAQSQAITLRIEATRAEIAARERANEEIMRLIFPQTRHDQ